MTQHDSKLHSPSKQIERAPSAAARFDAEPPAAAPLSAAKFAPSMDKISEQVIEVRERSIKMLQDKRSAKIKLIEDLQAQELILAREVDEINRSIDAAHIDIAAAREAIVSYHKERIDTP